MRTSAKKKKENNLPDCTIQNNNVDYQVDISLDSFKEYVSERESGWLDRPTVKWGSYPNAFFFLLKHVYLGQFYLYTEVREIEVTVEEF